MGLRGHGRLLRHALSRSVELKAGRPAFGGAAGAADNEAAAAAGLELQLRAPCARLADTAARSSTRSLDKGQRARARAELGVRTGQAAGARQRRVRVLRCDCYCAPAAEEASSGCPTARTTGSRQHQGASGPLAPNSTLNNSGIWARIYPAHQRRQQARERVPAIGGSPRSQRTAGQARRDCRVCMHVAAARPGAIGRVGAGGAGSGGGGACCPVRHMTLLSCLQKTAAAAPAASVQPRGGPGQQAA